MSLTFTVGSLGLAWLVTKLMIFIKLVLWRVSVWCGSFYFFRRGKTSGHKIYYVAAALIYLLSWSLLILFTAEIWIWIFHKWFHK